MINFDSFKILLYLLIQKISLFFGKSRLDCIKDITSYISKKNIVYTKVFQSLSSSKNELTKDESNVFKLYNENVPYNNNDLYDINDIINNFNKHLSNKIKLKSNIPYKSGIIAVVYEGYINNTPVIIKVIRKNIELKLKEGLNNCENILSIFKLFNLYKYYDLETIFLENKQDILNQINFNKEIENNKIMYNNYKLIEYIKIPKVYEEYSNINNKIIVMEQLYGNSIHDISSNEEKNIYFKLYNKFIFKSILFNRTYHADLHPGNLFFINNNGKYSIGIIDFGLIGNITKDLQNCLFNFLKYMVIEQDIHKSTQLIINKLIEPSYNYKNLSQKDKNILNDNIGNIVEDIIINNKHIDLNFIYNTNKTLNNYNLKLSRIFCKVEMAIAVGGSVSKYLSDSNHNNIYYENLKEVLNEIINPKILDY